MVHGFDQIEIGNGGGQEDKDEIGSAPSVEDDGCDKQDNVAPLDGNKEVEQQECRQEIEEEYVTAEYHGEELKIEN